METNYRRAMTEHVPVRFQHFYAPWQQWFEINADPMSGGRLGIFFREINERKRAEGALRASDEQLRLIADTAPVLIAHCDRAHRYKFVNEPYAARFGLRREQVLGKHFAEIVGEAAYASIRPHVEEFPDTVGTIIEASYRRSAREQVPVHFESYYAPLEQWFDIRCKALVELHGGLIRAESDGTGQVRPLSSSCRMGGPSLSKNPRTRRPRATSSGPACASSSSKTTPTPRAPSAACCNAGFAVTPAADVATGTALAGSQPFDVLVSDLGLPDGSGYELMRAVRPGQRVPGIAMSGYGMDEDMRRSREAGFTEHLVKPIDVPQLIAAIQRVARDRSG